LSHLLSLLHQLSGTIIDSLTRRRTPLIPARNGTAKTDQLANVTTNYGYDSIYQVLQATQGGTTTESYTYDPVAQPFFSLKELMQWDS
jgi:hypothetical protein